MLRIYSPSIAGSTASPAASLSLTMRAAAVALLSCQAAAQAQSPPVTQPDAAWPNGIALSAQIEGGAVANPSAPKTNFGQLFTADANQPLLNQVLLTASRPLDPKATLFDWGFKLQVMYGADARFTRFPGMFDSILPSGDRNQIDITEANVQVHLPRPFAGGTDIKAGQYSSPLGFETIDPSTNPFYSHSYIFNFGLPLKHTGVLANNHVSPLLDAYLGVDTGANTSFGPDGDNNSAVAVVTGLGLTLLDGDLTVLALTHIGPENPTRAFLAGYNADRYYRYFNDLVVTYKASPDWTLTTEANLVRDDALGAGSSGIPKPANAFGVAQYASHPLSQTLTLNVRAEVFRDDNAMFVAAYPGVDSYVNAEEGLPARVSLAPRATTYAEATIGLSYKPDLPSPVSVLLIRPELRYDRALGGTHPFNSGRDNGALTLAVDVVLGF